MAKQKVTQKKGAIWMRAFPDQAKALRPERSAAGGVKARSTPERIRMEVYKAIRKLYLAKHPFCECCRLIFGFDVEAREATSLHHQKGRAGWLLVDCRWFKSTCSDCHRFIHENPTIARSLGLLAKAGNWNKAE